MSEFHMYPTDKLGTWLIESESKKHVEYILHNVGTAFVTCSCPAAAIHGECKHQIFVLERTIKELEMVETEARVEETQQVISGRELMVTQQNGSIIRADQAERAIMLRNTAASLGGAFIELLPLAQAMLDAKLLPNGMNVPQCALVMQRGLELGIPPLSALEFLYVVDNRVKLMGQMVQALIQRDGRGRVEILDSTDEYCRARGLRPGYEPLEILWTTDMAAKANLTKNFGWQKYPADMLRWKAVARIGRLMFADILGGMDVADPGNGQTFDSVTVVDSPANRLETPNLYNPQTRDVPPQPQPEPEPKTASPAEWISDWTKVRRETGVTKEQLAAYFGTETVGTKQIQSKMDEGMTLTEICNDAIRAWVSMHTPPEEVPDEGEFTEVELPFE